MNIFNRVILSVYMLSMTAVSLLIISVPFNLISLTAITDLLSNESYKWYFFVSGFLLLAVSIKLLISGIMSDNRDRKGIIKLSEYGEIRISVETFESLAMRAVKQISGIKDIKVRVAIAGETVSLTAKLLVLPDVNIPKVVQEVQVKTKEYIESITDIHVNAVRVVVQNITSASTLRVE